MNSSAHLEVEMSSRKDEDFAHHVPRLMNRSFILGWQSGLLIGAVTGTPLGALIVYLLLQR